MRRILAFLLLAALLLSLAGCGAEVGVLPPAMSPAGKPWGLVQETYALPEGMQIADAQCLVGNTVFVSDNTDGPLLGYVGPDGESGLLSLPASCKYIYALCQADGALAVLAGMQESGSAAPVGGEPAYRVFLYDEGGEPLSQLRVQPETEAGRPVFTRMLYNDGDYILASETKLVRFGPDGAQLAASDDLDPGLIFKAVTMSGGRLLCCTGAPFVAGTTLYVMDAASLEMENAFEYPRRELCGFGTSLSGELLVNDAGDGSGVYTLNAESGKLESVFLWQENADVLEQRYDRIVELDSVYLALGAELGAVYSYRLSDRADARTELTLAVLGSEKPSIVDFNRDNKDYRVKIVAYDSEEQLKLTLSTGKGADIYFVSASYLLKDINCSAVFEDLFPLLDADDECGRDALVPSLVETLSRESALYLMPTSFCIDTYFCRDGSLSGPSVTMDELSAAAESSTYPQPFPSWMDQETLGEKMASACSNSYVDWNSRESFFDSGGFARILEACKASRYDLNGGDDLGFLQYRYLQGVFSAASIEKFAGPDYTYVGFPNDTGKSGCFFDPLHSFAISAVSKHKEGAWQFIRSFLSEEAQKKITDGFPVIASALETQINMALEGKLVTVYGDSATLSEGAEEKLRRLISDTDGMMNRTVYTLILEEYSAFCSGAYSAQQTAQNIQNRVSLYLAEQS